VKTQYRGHEIDVTRGLCMGGWSMIFYWIFRVSDGYECTSGFSDTTDTVSEFTMHMKERVDAELAEADPWCEMADAD
jgi:hypothetical protein